MSGSGQGKVSAGAAIALAMVEVLCEDGIITEGQRKAILLRAMTMTGQVPAAADAEELLAQEAIKVVRNG